MGAAAAPPAWSPTLRAKVDKFTAEKMRQEAELKVTQGSMEEYEK